MITKDLLERFSSGFQNFQEVWFSPDEDLYTKLRLGQSPHSMVIACSDSRVDPAILLDSNPGELFIVRNVANLVPPYEPDGHYHGVSAALEYAVRHLQIPNIIVMGHARCGGFTSLLNSQEHSTDEFLNVWMGLAWQAKAQVDWSLPQSSPEARQRACEMWGIRSSLQNLLTYPWLKNAVEEANLHLHGLYFDLNAGELLYFNSAQQEFLPLKEAVSLLK